MLQTSEIIMRTVSAAVLHGISLTAIGISDTRLRQCQLCRRRADPICRHGNDDNAALKHSIAFFSFVRLSPARSASSSADADIRCGATSRHAARTPRSSSLAPTRLDTRSTPTIGAIRLNHPRMSLRETVIMTNSDAFCS
jgi:hypothetical protein